MRQDSVVLAAVILGVILGVAILSGVLLWQYKVVVAAVILGVILGVSIVAGVLLWQYNSPYEQCVRLLEDDNKYATLLLKPRLKIREGLFFDFDVATICGRLNR